MGQSMVFHERLLNGDIPDPSMVGFHFHRAVSETLCRANLNKYNYAESGVFNKGTYTNHIFSTIPFSLPLS